jgi:hypothetical protein
MGAGAFSTFYGPWTIAIAFPLGDFLYMMRSAKIAKSGGWSASINGALCHVLPIECERWRRGMARGVWKGSDLLKIEGTGAM